MSEKKTYQIYCRGQFVEVSEEIYTYYTRDKWRAEYAEKGRKREHIYINESDEITVTPSKEDSLDRLIEKGEQLSDSNGDFSNFIIERLDLLDAVSKLSEQEQYLIRQLYFFGKTERELAKEYGINHNAIHKKKMSVLAKLHKLLKNS